jgi:hypothetical protein
MNKRDKERIAYVATAIAKLWKNLVVEAEKSGNPSWHRNGERLAYRDALQAMKYAKLIDDYSLDEIVMDGVKIDVAKPSILNRPRRSLLSAST